MKITYLGHSTCLIDIAGTRWLTDPIFSAKIFFGFRRQQPLPIDPATLPDLTAVLLSHLHYDHFDIPSYKYISCRTPIVMPRGLGRYVSGYLPNPRIELATWSHHRFGEVRVTCVPARHHGGRLSHLRYTATAGFLIQGGDTTIFFAGDTGYLELFSEIGSLAPIDLALLPIGPVDPSWLFKPRHLDPADALQAFKALGAKQMIPIHWGTFRLGFDSPTRPLDMLKKMIPADDRDRIHILEPGESFSS